MGVEKRLLLDRIALHAAYVSPRHQQAPAFVEAHLADANRALGERTAVPAGVAAKSPVGQRFVELAHARLAREHLSQGGHLYQLYRVPGLEARSWGVGLRWHDG